ncbi:MAG TPA: hypothetical protein DIC60_02880 [Lachnospiraceae bacterium]|nr:hypothetical protein [Lachnospiraceae bacterium]
MLNQTMKISRQQLYDEIWQVSVAGVARKYNLNYSKLIAKCKEANIPFPSSGYWTRRNMGKDVINEVVDLPPSNIETVELLLTGVKTKKIVVSDKLVLKEESEAEINSVGSADEATSDITVEERLGELIDKEEFKSKEDVNYDNNILSFLSEDERRQVLDVAVSLVIRNSRSLHEQLVKYKNTLDEWKQKEKEAQKKQFYNPRYDKPESEPTFFNEISDATRTRAIRILDAVFCAVESLGGKINADLTLKIKSDIVRIRVVENQDKVSHELTKEEARKLVEYNDEVKKYSWTSKPKIPKFDYVYNGRLRIVLGDRNYIRDNSEKLEDRLGDILIALYEKSEEIRIEREIREDEQRKRKEEAQRQEEIRKREAEEIKRTKELVNQAEDYKIACEIRQYISAVMQKENLDAEKMEWIQWAKRKADWYDPIIATMDEYLGKREHSKSSGEKELNESNLNRYGWRW